jgi:hypothetical protein
MVNQMVYIAYIFILLAYRNKKCTIQFVNVSPESLKTLAVSIKLLNAKKS